MMTTFRRLPALLVLLLVIVPARNLGYGGDGPGGEPFRVKALYIDGNGVKWFGTSRGLYRYDNLVWKYYTTSDHLVGREIHALTFEAMDQLWIATSEGVSVVTLGPEGVTGSTGYTTADGLLDASVSDIALDSHGRKFFGSASGITVLREGSADSLLYRDYMASMVNAPVNALFCYNDTLYVGADGGIGRFVAGVDGISGASRWTSNWGITPLSGNIKSILVDSRGHQWFGTDSGAEEHVGQKAKENWFLYTTDEGLVDNYVLAIAEDPDGGMWFGTRGGVSSLTGGTWTSYTASDGLVSDTVYDIGFDADGSVWFATERGICRLKDGSFTDLYLDVAQDRSIVRTFNTWYDPLSGTIGITYLLREPGEVTARLYTLDGRLAGQWSDLPSGAGTHHGSLSTAVISGALKQGVYIVQLQQEKRSETKKLVIVR